MVKKHRLPFGAFVNGNQTTFKLFAPKAEKVSVVIFVSHDDESGIEYPMFPTEDGIWKTVIQGIGYGTLYGYRLEGPPSHTHVFDPGIIIGDPYAKATVGRNVYHYMAKSLIIKDDFNWEGDTWIKLDPRDAIICELHIRDMTNHPTAGVKDRGTYLALVDPNQRGGLAHIDEMGYNAVELLPAMDFANLEVPYRDQSAPMRNNWNPYARNHWGFMTTYFFAPENYYATDSTGEPGAWMGIAGQAVNEFKEMVKIFHSKGIAVLMDVVYNHVSHSDYHPFKFIDREIYFRLDKNGNHIDKSGCGNDTRTESPVMRQLIFESIRYWMIEYHIDGFRFDLANLIDRETCQAIIEDARRINRHVLFIAEPWGGGYDPQGFSDIGWASWNDQFRDGVKGEDPVDRQGFIFGRWWKYDNRASLHRFVMGSLRELDGQYLDVAHCVNYLESHDDYTLGDFLRIGSGEVERHQVIENVTPNATVRGKQLSLNKLGALFLFTSQGMVMVHEGQSWGRSKVIAPTDVPDNQVGQIDCNSYNKDNETNWLNWDHKALNRELVEYYKGLIELRKTYPEFRHSDPDDFKFFDVGEKVAIAYLLQDKFIVGMNGSQGERLNVDLPKGLWRVIVDDVSVDLKGKGSVSEKMSIPPTSGLVLKKEIER